MNTLKILAKIAATCLFASVSTLANAIPTLQLGIAGGTYNTSTQTIVASGPTFSLFAYLKPNSSNQLSDFYFLSMALSPQVSASANLGSFTVNGNTVNATSDMTYGTPPLDAFGHDAGDLAPHGAFPTYFSQLGFQFSNANTSGIFNTQDHPSWGPQSGTGMYFQQFDIDVTNLAPGYSIHFDLYNTKLCQNDRKQCDGSGDIDITQFAPFSHDAQSGVTTVPEPGTLALFGAGLFALGLARRRKSR